MQNILIERVSRQELKRELEIIDILIAIVFVALAIISLIYYTPLKAQISTQVETYGFIGLFLISAFMELLPQIFDPIFPMIVLIAEGFNVHLTILITCIGSTVGSIAGFEIGRKYGFKYLVAMFEDSSLMKIENFINKYGKLFMALAALTPLPYFPIVFGAMNVSRKEFFIYGILCRVLGFIFVGYAIHLGFVSMNL